jgi:hypothetical protein
LRRSEDNDSYLAAARVEDRIGARAELATTAGSVRSRRRLGDVAGAGAQGGIRALAEDLAATRVDRDDPVALRLEVARDRVRRLGLVVLAPTTAIVVVRS